MILFFYDAYQYPEEKWNLEGILREDKVNQVQYKMWPVDPEVIIWWLDYQITFNYWMLFGNLIRQPSNDMLKFSAKSKQKLQMLNREYLVSWQSSACVPNNVDAWT